MRIREGDPLEIYTEKDGGVIFKKYSPIGELSEFAAQMCESLHKTTGEVAAICDRDSVIAVSGGARRELMEKRVSPQLETVMENRSAYAPEGRAAMPVTEGGGDLCVSAAAPILSAGDVLGCVLFAAPRDAAPGGVTEQKLAQTAAGFLGRQMEG
jgi:AbrB family transcriptional regulator (stage V sporulation protein T)